MSQTTIIPKILYHATTNEHIKSLREGISLSIGRDELDFGKGFYLTSNRDQAIRWARFKGKQRNSSNGNNAVKGAIIKYRVDDKFLNDLNSYFFESVSPEWAEFVFANRSNDTTKHNNLDNKYDYVYGPLADGTEISISVLEYQSGIITFDEFHSKITGYKYPFPLDHQFSFHSEESLKSLQLMEVSVV